MADFRVHRIGEVDRRGSRRQRHHIALGGEHIDLSRSEVIAQRIQELTGISGLALPFQELTQPRKVVCGGFARIRLLVLPMGGNAEFGCLVHLGSSYLHLHDLAVRTDHRRVQRLIHVEFRHRDEVLETTGYRAPLRVDGAQDCVAVTDAVHQNPHTHEVVDVVEIATTHDHLLVDGVVVLGASGHTRLYPMGLQLTIDVGYHLGQVLLA